MLAPLAAALLAQTLVAPPALPDDAGTAEPDPPVQRPGASDPESGAPAEPEPFEPTPMEPVEPEPFKPTPMEPVDPATPAPTPAPAPAPSAAPSPSVAPAPAPGPAAPYVAPGASRRDLLVAHGQTPPQVGYGLIIGSALMGTVVITKQLASLAVCDNGRVNCGEAGWVDRFLLAGAGMAGAAGGYAHGKRMAYDDVATGREPRRVGARMAAGWLLFTAGLGLGVADLSMTVLCYRDFRGPYAITEVDDNPFKVRCRSGTSMILADSATVVAAAGGGLALGASHYDRARAHYEAHLFTRVRVTPWGGPGGAGLGVAGRF